ncbi:IS3 family transposase [Streptomyces sp. NPDC008121]|uniref:IS3 family transposase n=1 Tax=Streptomyces sp. NPDC008121 TaxID=3364809 RepID=UPI0036E4EE50
MSIRLGVSRAGSCEWRSKPDSATTARREKLKILVAEAFEDYDSTYGYRRVHAQLCRWGVTGRSWSGSSCGSSASCPASPSRSGSA